jgi:hypothetical protein
MNSSSLDYLRKLMVGGEIGYVEGVGGLLGCGYLEDFSKGLISRSFEGVILGVGLFDVEERLCMMVFKCSSFILVLVLTV